MGYRRSAAAAALLALLIAAAPAVLVGQAVQRSLFVSVVDERGMPVPNLGPSDFVVREDNVSREVLSVAPATEPMRIAILVDNSQAAEGLIRDYREALPAFIKALVADGAVAHQFAIIALAERPTIVQDYTTDPALASKAAGRIFAFSASGTYLLEGIIETSRGMMKQQSSRPVIVAVTTEGPELSDRFYQAVLEPLRASGAAFHVFVVGTPKDASHDRSVVLDQGTRESGGRYETVLIGSALTGRMRELATDLRQQYRVTYARPQTLIPPERVTVTAAKPGLTARGTALVEPPNQERR